MTKAPDLIDMIRALVSVPSVSCTDAQHDMGNLAVLNRLADWLEGLGFRIDLLPVAEGKANLLATIGPDGDDGLVLAGHADTVPYDVGAWRYDPFGGEIVDDRIFGLGSSDMKCFFAFAIDAATRCRADRLKRPLTILATADEESSMSGARALASAGLRPGRFAVIGEPTGLKPIRMHKGVMMERIRVIGRAGHSSNPALGANALEGMHQVIGSLLAFRAELQSRYRNPNFDVAVPTLNLGSIHGGDNPNRICGQCELQIDLRPLPGMAIEELRADLYRRLEESLTGHPQLRLETTPLFDGLPPFETAADARLVHTCEHLSGATAGAVAFGTEAPFLSGLGMETVVLGPGDIAQAHQPDEFLALERIGPMQRMLDGLIERFCIRGD